MTSAMNRCRISLQVSGMSRRCSTTYVRTHVVANLVRIPLRTPPAGAASRPVSSRRPIRRWSSSSCTAGPTAARVPGSGRGVGVRCGRTGPRCGPSGPRTSLADGQGLRSDLRPPHDRLSSHADDQRWPHPRADRSRRARPSGCTAERKQPDAARHPGLSTPRAMTDSRRRAAIEAACSGESVRTPFSVIRAWNCCSG